LKIEKRIVNPPASIRVYPDESLIFGRNLIGGAIPLQESLVKKMDRLDKRNFQMDPGGHNGFSHRLPELGDNRLLCLIHNKSGKDEGESSQNDDQPE
jgi:hypothetical protein